MLLDFSRFYEIERFQLRKQHFTILKPVRGGFRGILVVCAWFCGLGLDSLDIAVFHFLRTRLSVNSSVFLN